MADVSVEKSSGKTLVVQWTTVWIGTIRRAGAYNMDAYNMGY